MARRLAWLLSVGLLSASAALIAAAHAQALQTAPASPARMIDAWPGIVLFCMPPPSREAWGATACGIATGEAQRQAAAASIRLVAVSAAEAGLSGGAKGAAPALAWPEALRLFLQLHRVGGDSRQWRLSAKAYGFTPPGDSGQAPKWRHVYDDFAILDEGKEVRATEQVAPLLLGQFFSTVTKPRS